MLVYFIMFVTCCYYLSVSVMCCDCFYVVLFSITSPCVQMITVLVTESRSNIADHSSCSVLLLRDNGPSL